MSLVNLLSSLLTPGFPTVYLARDSVMSEVEARTGTKYERVVADLTVQPDPDLELASLDPLHLTINLTDNADPEIFLGDLASNFRPVSCSATITIAHFSHHRGHRSNLSAGLAYLLLLAITFAVIGSLSRFHRGESTLAQRAWILTWLVVDSFRPTFLVYYL